MTQNSDVQSPQMQQLLDKIEHNQQVLEKFQQFELKMLAAANLSCLLEVILRESIEHFSLSDCRLLWFDEHDLSHCLYSQMPNHCVKQLILLQSAQKATLPSFSTNKPVLTIADANMQSLFADDGSDVNIKSIAMMPLIQAEQLTGVLLFGSDQEQRFSADKATDFLEHMALVAAVCIHNQLNQECVRRLSMLDGLTQVKNRRCFELDIAQEVAKAQRYKTALSCLFIDVDFFKKINDQYGHQAGDDALVSLAKWVQSQLREGDHLARFGGEEFAVLLPQCDQLLAEQVAERIRQYVQNSTVSFGDLHLKLTLSIGVTTFAPNASSNLELNGEQVIKKLLSSSDAAVYDAKNSGRNQVCVREFGHDASAKAVH